MIRNTRGGAIFKVYAPHCDPHDAQRVREILQELAGVMMGGRHAHVTVQSAEEVNPARCHACVASVRETN